MGNEWNKGKYKAKVQHTFRNQTDKKKSDEPARYVPGGQAVKVNWEQGGKSQSQTLQFGQSMIIEQTVEPKKAGKKLKCTIVPTRKGMKHAELNVDCSQTRDWLYNIRESELVLGLTLKPTYT
jgi:hypothetical protein